MTKEQVRQYCLSFDGVKEETTRDNKWTVYCKDGNVFLLICKTAPIPAITIKLKESRGEELQDEYNIVSPSYLDMHNWYDVDIDNSFPNIQIEEWIRESFNLVIEESKNADREKYVNISKLL